MIYSLLFLASFPCWNVTIYNFPSLHVCFDWNLFPFLAMSFRSSACCWPKLQWFLYVHGHFSWGWGWGGIGFYSCSFLCFRQIQTKAELQIVDLRYFDLLTLRQEDVCLDRMLRCCVARAVILIYPLYYLAFIQLWNLSLIHTCRLSQQRSSIFPVNNRVWRARTDLLGNPHQQFSTSRPSDVTRLSTSELCSFNVLNQMFTDGKNISCIKYWTY